MNDMPQPSIEIDVDPCNPGQFFACCGLLELADRLWPGAEGWFTENDRKFCIACEGTLGEALARLVMDPPTEVLRLESNGLEVAPILAPLAFSFDGGASTALVLDAWTRIAAVKKTVQVISNPPWNFWSGQQTPFRIWTALRAELVGQLVRQKLAEHSDLFERRLFQKGRFGFDPGPAWNAVDVGFSPNEHGLEVDSSPATEVLAIIGLQRFRPILTQNRKALDYSTWSNPNAPSVAAAAIVGAIQDRNARRFRASVVSRGQSYSALSFAYSVGLGVSDE